MSVPRMNEPGCRMCTTDPPYREALLFKRRAIRRGLPLRRGLDVALLEIGDHPEAHIGICLLYTSPSPRD